MARFANGFVTLILKDHQNDVGNTPPNGSLWLLRSFTDWEKGTSYTLTDFVFVNNKYYKCNNSHTSDNTNMPGNDSFWDTIQEWANNVDYVSNDRIVYQDIVYQCISNHTSIYGPDENGDIDVSDKFVAIEHNDTVPQSLKLTFNSKNGRFMTRGPIIKINDRIYYEATDHNGKITKDVFHVRSKKRNRGIGKGKLYNLSCPHQTEYEWKKTISFPGRKISGDTALRKIAKQLNENKGSKDPTISVREIFDSTTKTGSRLSTNTANDYIFESVKLDQSLKKIKDIEQQPKEGGGQLQAFFIRFKSKYDHATHTGLDEAEFQAFEQGFTKNGSEFNNTPKVTLFWDTIESNNRPNILTLDTDEDPPKATNIIAIGHKKSGDYLGAFTKFAGAKDVFTRVPTIWDTGINYNFGELVTFNLLTYECILDHLSSNSNDPEDVPSNTWINRLFEIPDAYFDVVTYAKAALVLFNGIAYKSIESGNLGNDPAVFDDKWVRVNYVPVEDYSPVTKDNAQEWINFLPGAKYADQNIGRTGVLDANCIIHDKRHPRNIVRVFAKDPSLVPADHFVDGNIPDRYKVLVAEDNGDDTATSIGTGIFAGSDPTGRAFPGSVAEYRDPENDGTGTWFVFKETFSDEEIFDYDEALSWTKSPCGSGQPLSFIGDDGSCNLGSRPSNITWIKGAYRIVNLVIGKSTQFLKNSQFDCFHPLQFDAQAGRVEVTNKKIMDDDSAGTSAVSFVFDPKQIRAQFAGANFWSLTPLTKNTIPYGGAAPTVGSKIKLSVFDLYNMFRTHTGKEEWFGPESEDYYPIQSIDFTEKFIVTDAAAGTFDIKGDYDMGIFLVDDRHNVVKIEYDHSRNNVPLDKSVSLSKIDPYFAVPGLSVIFSAPEPEILDIFQPREWMFGGFYTADSFDSQGRYTGTGAFGSNRYKTKHQLEFILDAFRYGKPLVVTNVDEPTNKPDRNIETTRQSYSGIISYPQLKNLVKGLAKLFAFERKAITHNRKAKYEIQFGDPIYTVDPQSFSESDDSLPNTILAVANSIITMHNKPVNGPGGSTQKINLGTRFFPVT